MAVIPIKPLVQFDEDLIRRLNQSGPRYTSYPTADRMHKEFSERDYYQAVLRRELKPLSVYVHIPFCESLCYYCGCNKIITRDHSKAHDYLSYLYREIALQGPLFGRDRRVEQLHFGGGTPTYLSDAQMDELLGQLRQHFDFAPDEVGEYSIEVDPRTTSPERIHTLRRQGFNRLSLGVQDFDPDVQAAVNRIQPEEMTLGVMQAAREAGFRSISVDLIYGLPLQSAASMERTLDKVVKANPDRIAVYNYAHLPHLFKSQRLIPTEQIPAPEAKLEMMRLSIERLVAAGYVYIGMDHFAKPDDELAVAQREGKLHRNFQGYSTHAEADLVALGVSAISAMAGTYSQNEKVLADYYARLDRRELPIARGIVLDDDDILRRRLITDLMCNFELRYANYGEVDFASYFADELAALKPMEADGLLSFEADGLRVSQKGRLVIRNLCMVFDRYLKAPRAEGPVQPRYSRTL
ncbi:oxygen-independent coproporphyrinogen III oxidase [Massilia sp. TS11]|uniref:oxygen-independent coproporphyrinogen III oxidase n=1 Tax=Massilia sp. TS11 TaxID=2908003 RepID=UPI001EDB393F|nr:oxygen-independent coproporphyrinogen III oxidase [Massilia sp. TS11]MCG2583998.1 oxygen-independent coproporphyrinogen III oxidase [Massilia sp. TS11]